MSSFFATFDPVFRCTSASLKSKTVLTQRLRPCRDRPVQQHFYLFCCSPVQIGRIPKIGGPIEACAADSLRIRAVQRPLLSRRILMGFVRLRFFLLPGIIHPLAFCSQFPNVQHGQPALPTPLFPSITTLRCPIRCPAGIRQRLVTVETDGRPAVFENPILQTLNRTVEYYPDALWLRAPKGSCLCSLFEICAVWFSIQRSAKFSRSVAQTQRPRTKRARAWGRPQCRHVVLTSVIICLRAPAENHWGGATGSF